MKSLIIFLVSFLSAVTVPAQCDDMENDLEIPDTFAIVKSYEIDTVSSLTAIGGKVTDTLSSPLAYFIKSDEMTQIALKKRNKFIVFKALFYTGTSSEFSYERQDVNGKGSKELILRWTSLQGHSGIFDGFSIEESGIVIWDLDNATRLMNFQNRYHYDYWWTGATYEEGDEEKENEGPENEESDGDDSTSTDASEDENEAGSCSVCQSYNVTVEKMLVKIEEMDSCSKEETEAKRIYKYRLTKKGFVRVDNVD